MRSSGASSCAGGPPPAARLASSWIEGFYIRQQPPRIRKRELASERKQELGELPKRETESEASRTSSALQKDGIQRTLLIPHQSPSIPIYSSHSRAPCLTKPSTTPPTTTICPPSPSSSPAALLRRRRPPRPQTTTPRFFRRNPTRRPASTLVARTYPPTTLHLLDLCDPKNAHPDNSRSPLLSPALQRQRQVPY